MIDKNKTKTITKTHIYDKQESLVTATERFVKFGIVFIYICNNIDLLVFW